MTQNLIWPTMPIHAGLNSRGLIRRKIKRHQKQHASLKQQPKYETLVVGNADIFQKSNIKIRRSISPTRTHNRELKMNKLSKTFLMDNRKELFFSQNSFQNFQEKAQNTSNQKDLNNLELTTIRWANLRKKTYRMRHSNLSHYETDKLSENKNYNSGFSPEEMRKVVGLKINSCSPMNRKVASRLN